jgi:D-xylose transport system ATP-binding protein
MSATTPAATPEATDAAVILSVDHVSKSFGPVQALRDVSLRLRAGEISALVGDNGAGKSTLVRCVCGIQPTDSGTLTFNGSEVGFDTAEDARTAGIETVHQNLALVEDLAVWQNLFLNRELRRARVFLDRPRMKREARSMVSALAINVPEVGSRVRRLSGGQRQAVAICRAAGFQSRLVVMDEPTAALGVQETERVEALIRRLRDEGRSLLIVSHNFEQVMRLSDHVWVMRAGRCVGGRRTAQTTSEEIVGMVTGAVQR